MFIWSWKGFNYFDCIGPKISQYYYLSHLWAGQFPLQLGEPSPGRLRCSTSQCLAPMTESRLEQREELKWMELTKTATMEGRISGVGLEWTELDWQGLEVVVELPFPVSLLLVSDCRQWDPCRRILWSSVSICPPANWWRWSHDLESFPVLGLIRILDLREERRKTGSGYSPHCPHPGMVKTGTL